MNHQPVNRAATRRLRRRDREGRLFGTLQRALPARLCSPRPGPPAQRDGPYTHQLQMISRRYSED